MSGERLQGVLFENWGLKLVSLAIATLMWIFVVGGEKTFVHYEVALSFRNLPEDLVVASPVPETVSVKVSGPKTLLATIRPQQLSVVLDLTGVAPGESEQEIFPSHFDLPRSIDVTEIVPDKLDLVLDRIDHKTVPVTVALRGNPHEDFVVARAGANPNLVTLVGSAKLLSKLDEVQTQPQDVGGLDKGFSRTVDLALPPAGIKQADADAVQVEVVIREAILEKDFQGVPIRLPEGWKSEPEGATVQLKGTKRNLAALNVQSIEVGLAEGIAPEAKKTLPLRATAPEGFTVISVQPEQARIDPVPEPKKKK